MIHYFKKKQEENIYNFYKVYGGSGHTENGYQEVVCFLNHEPIIFVEHNEAGSLTGTWCTHEVGIPISKEEYLLAFKKATAGHFDIF